MKSFVRAVGLCILISLGVCGCGGRGSDSDGSLTGLSDVSGSAPGQLAATLNGPADGLTLDGMVLSYGTEDSSIDAASNMFRFSRVAAKNSDTLSIKSQPSNGRINCSLIGNALPDASIGCAYKTRFAYVFYPGLAQIKTFRVDAETDAFTYISTISYGRVGDKSVTLTTHPSKDFIYALSYNYSTITAFRVDPITGMLSAVGAPVDAPFEPYSLAINPSGKSAYLIDVTTKSLVRYSVDETTGALTESESIFIDAGREERNSNIAIDSSQKWLYIAASAQLYSFPLSGDGSLGTPIVTPATHMSENSYPVINALTRRAYWLGSIRPDPAIDQEVDVLFTANINPDGSYAQQPQAPLVLAVHARIFSVDPAGRYLSWRTDDGTIATLKIDSMNPTVLTPAGNYPSENGKATAFSQDSRILSVAGVSVQIFIVNKDGVIRRFSHEPAELGLGFAQATTFF